MSYAVVRTGGKQVKVAEGDIIAVERLAGDPGAKVTFSDVLLVKLGDAVKVGEPTVSGAQVVATIQAQERGKKIVIRKFKRRKGYLRTRGHRQYQTRVRIDKISA